MLLYFLLVFLASFLVNEYLDDRLLAPVYIPGIILFFYLIDNYYSAVITYLGKKIVLLSCILWLVYPVSRSISNVKIWHGQLNKIPLDLDRIEYAPYFKKHLYFK